MDVYPNSGGLDERQLSEGPAGALGRDITLTAKKFASQVCRIGVGTVLCLIVPILADAQRVSNSPPSADVQKCAALTQLNLKDAPGGPALMTSAPLVGVPTTGLPRFTLDPSRFGNPANIYATSIHQYCDVTGYVAPQNKSS